MSAIIKNKFHVDPSLGNDREKSSYTTTVNKQRLRGNEVGWGTMPQAGR
jgi:hypothetical protein